MMPETNATVSQLSTKYTILLERLVSPNFKNIRPKMVGIVMKILDKNKNNHPNLL